MIGLKHINRTRWLEGTSCVYKTGPGFFCHLPLWSCNSQSVQYRFLRCESKCRGAKKQLFRNHSL